MTFNFWWTELVEFVAGLLAMLNVAGLLFLGWYLWRIRYDWYEYYYGLAAAFAVLLIGQTGSRVTMWVLLLSYHDPRGTNGFITTVFPVVASPFYIGFSLVAAFGLGVLLYTVAKIHEALYLLGVIYGLAIIVPIAVQLIRHWGFH